MTDDYLAAEASIIAHLETKTGMKVMAVTDIDAMEQKAQHGPAIFVIYAGEQEVKSAGNGKQTIITQLWAVVIAAKNTRNPLQGSQARSSAGPLMMTVLKGLSGFHPGTNAFTPLIPTKAPWPPSWGQGNYYYPLAFTTTIKIIGDEQP